jgi:hypothetical protein
VAAPPAAPAGAVPPVPGASPPAAGAVPPVPGAVPPVSGAAPPPPGAQENVPPVANPNVPPGEAAPRAAPGNEPPRGGLRQFRPESERHAPRSPSRHEPPARPLTGAEIQSTVQRYQSDIAQCLSDINMSTAPSKVDAQITIDARGEVSAVRITPAVGQPAVDRCLSKSLKSMRFHRHPPPDLKVTIPLKIQVL